MITNINGHQIFLLVKNKIKLLTLDVDGVLTDGGIYVTEKGDVIRKFNVKDGVGIKQALKAGIIVGFISAGKQDKLVRKRAAMLGVKLVYTGDREKLEVLKSWCAKLKIGLHEVAHVADDINDVGILSAVGLPACPADAIPEIKKLAKVVLKKKGGDACVREFVGRYLL